MKRTPLALFALALAAACVLALLPSPRPASAASDDHEVLHETMEVLAGNYRQVRRQMKDASKNADTADKLAQMIAATVKGKAAMPETATTEDLKTRYRVVMNELIIVLTQAENAALSGDQKKLQEYVMQANQVKGVGHELFIADDE